MNIFLIQNKTTIRGAVYLLTPVVFPKENAFILREGCRKKIRKKYDLLPYGKGGGSTIVMRKKTILLFCKFIFSESMQNHSRTPKTCFTPGLECLCHIYSYQDSFECSSEHSPIGEPLSLLALNNVAVKGHSQGQTKGMVDSGSPVIGLLNLVEP